MVPTMHTWKSEYLQSIKSAEAEDPIDLVFYRPLGFLLAKLSRGWRLSPTHLTLAGMGVGVWAGFLFSRPTPLRLILGILLFLLSGIFDSADGQLARISGQSTPFGLVVDGLCDNIVFISVYTSAASGPFFRPGESGSGRLLWRRGLATPGKVPLWIFICANICTIPAKVFRSTTAILIHSRRVSKS